MEGELHIEKIYIDYRGAMREGALIIHNFRTDKMRISVEYKDGAQMDEQIYSQNEFETLNAKAKILLYRLVAEAEKDAPL